jgi:N-acetylmuramoyl-L-alanine amidase
MKLAIIVGHTKISQGAFSKTLNSAEYSWNTDLANSIVSANSPTIEKKIFFRDVAGIAGAYAAGDAWGADAFIELHFNASHNETSTGTGVLYQTPKSKLLALALYKELSQALALPPWPKSTAGVCTPFQASGAQERGKQSLTASKKPSVLIEPFFGSNSNDAAMAQKNKKRMAEAMIKAAITFFNIKP